MAIHSLNSLEMPLLASAFSSALPHVICGVSIVNFELGYLSTFVSTVLSVVAVAWSSGPAIIHDAILY